MKTNKGVEIMNIEEKAYLFAENAHKEQKTKVTKRPYIEHPKEVGELLKEFGFSSEIVAAGYLHDVVEDTNVKLEEIEKEFGTEVSRFVKFNTEDKTKNWEERKKHTVETLKNASFEEKAFVAADKYSNMKRMIRDFDFVNDEEVFWGFFGRGKEKQKWYYQSVTESIFCGMEKEQIPKYFFELEEMVNEFFE